MTLAHLTELRGFLKQYKVTPTGPEFAEQAATISGLIPAMVDAISDEELEALELTVWDYLMFNLIAGQTPQSPGEEERDDPNSRPSRPDSEGPKVTLS